MKGTTSDILTPVPTNSCRKVRLGPGDTKGFPSRSSVTGSRNYSNLIPNPVSNLAVSPDPGYASLVLIIVDMVCKLVSKFQAP